MQSSPSFVQWLTAWVVIIVVLYALTRVEWGKAIVASVLWLSIILLVVVHYKEIVDVFAKGNITGGQY